MAFDVTPTSGEGPYLFTAQFSDAVNIDGVHYRIEYFQRTEVGFCPVDFNMSSLVPEVSLQLLQTGSYLRTDPVSPGTCLGGRLIIRDLSSTLAVSVSYVSIDNTV